jgi:hypothetical protein
MAPTVFRACRRSCRCTDTPADLLTRPVVEVVLELVDLGVHGDDDVEEGRRDVVDEPEEELADRCFPRCCDLEGLGAPGLTPRRCLPHGDDEIGSRDEVHLPVDDAILLRKRQRVDKDAQHVRPMTLEQRPCVLVARCGRQGLHDVRVDSGRKRTEELLVGRIEEIDPAGTGAHGQTGP